jgi:uncharacterized membrane protein
LPAEAAFEHWTDYGKWSRIFKNESASAPRSRRTSAERDGQVRVSSKIGPSRRQWTADLVAVQPGRRIDWEARDGLQAKGTTSFHAMDDRLTRIMVEIEYGPSGFMETVGNFFRMQRRRVRRDLRLFKHYVEVGGGAGGRDTHSAAEGKKS